MGAVELCARFEARGLTAAAVAAALKNTGAMSVIDADDCNAWALPAGARSTPTT